MMTRKVSGRVRPRPDKYNIKYYDIIIEAGKEEGTGKRKQISYRINTTDRTEAENYLLLKKAEFLQGETIEPSKMTVEDFLMEYIDTYAKVQSPATYRDYLGAAKHYLIPEFGKCKLQRLDSMMIQKAYNKWRQESPKGKKPLSIETIKHANRVLKAALNRAQELGYIRKNPAKGVKIPKSNKSEVDVYTTDEIKKLQSAVKGTDMELPVALLFDCILRRSELLGLSFDDIDFETKTINIQHAWVESDDSKKPILKDCKTDCSNRKIVVTEYTIRLLKKEWMKYNTNKIKFGESFFDSNRVVCQKNGKPYLPKSFSRKWTDTLRKNNLRHIKLHGTRHSAISFLISEGIPLHVVQQRAGHKTPEITLSVYSHVAKDKQSLAADFLESRLFSY